MVFTVVTHVLAAFGGGIAVGVVAHRWPSVFNKGVTVANAVDAKVNAGVATVAAKAADAVAKK